MKFKSSLIGCLLVANMAVAAQDNLINNGQFELETSSFWLTDGAEISVIDDSQLNSKVLHIFNKKFAYSTAYYPLYELKPGYTYLVKLLVKSDQDSVGMIVTYRGDELTNAGLPKDSAIDLGTVESNGQWLEYSRYVSLPDNFDQEQPIKIKPKTGAGNFSDIYIDNVEFYEVGKNSHISDADSYEDVTTNYWTAKSINGKSLDVMRVNYADTLGSPEDAPSATQTHTAINDHLLDNLEYGWRFATLDDMKAIRNFYVQENIAASNSGFLNLNGGSWSPKQDKDIWNITIPDPEFYSSEIGTVIEGGLPWTFTLKPDTEVGIVKRNKSLQPGQLATAPLVVRDALVIQGANDIIIEATGPVTNVAEFTELLPVVLGGATPEPITASIDLSALEIGNYDVQWSTIDLEDREISVSQSIVVEDTTPPVFSNLSRITLTYPLDPNSANFSLLTANDLVDGEIEAIHDGDGNFELGCYNLNWTATDSSGNSTTVRQKLQVIDKNECPLAIISGEQQVIERQTLTLNGTQSTVDASKTISYKWTVESGHRFNLQGSESSITFDAPSLDEDSQYVIKLEVSDGEQSDYSLFTLTVLADPELPSIAPVAHVEPIEIVNENNEFILDASGSFVDESLQGEFSWQVIEGPELEFFSTGKVAKVIAPEVEQDTSTRILLTIDDGINQVSKEIDFVVQNTTPKVQSQEQDPYRNEKSFSGATVNLLALMGLMILGLCRRKV